MLIQRRKVMVRCYIIWFECSHFAAGHKRVNRFTVCVTKKWEIPMLQLLIKLTIKQPVLFCRTCRYSRSSNLTILRLFNSTKTQNSFGKISSSRPQTQALGIYRKLGSILGRDCRKSWKIRFYLTAGYNHKILFRELWGIATFYQLLQR